MRASCATWAMAALVAPASADPVKFCAGPSNAICYSVGIPPSTSSTGTGNMYFQISAPSTYSWVALGTGEAMAGSNNFIVYQDGSGNLTVSPRLGTSYNMPVLDTSSTAAKLTLLSGSGVSGNTMIANIMCSNCESWNGGSIDVKGDDTAGAWIGAWKLGSSLATTDKSAHISIHDDNDQFNVDMSKAVISADANPFLEQTTTTTGSNSTSTGSASTSGNATATTSKYKHNPVVVAAHGIGMVIAFAIMMPIGAMIFPVLGSFWLHTIWQSAAWLLMLAALGLGVAISVYQGQLRTVTHTVFGIIIVGVLFFQPILGWVHHRQYLKTLKRTVWSMSHIWIGRIFMLLAIINGGLGLQLSHESKTLTIAYSVVAGVLYILYIITIFLPLNKFRKRKSSTSSDDELRGESSNEVREK